MQPHIRKAYNFLDKHLPSGYLALTKAELKKQNVVETDQVIRNVRNQLTTSNIAVLNALLTVARKHKKENDKLKRQLQE